MKLGRIVGGLAALAIVVVVWIVYGRFAVEGGKVPWAVVNQRPDVLKEALPTATQEQKDKALAHAASRHDPEAAKLLLAAGADPNSRKQYCLVSTAAVYGGPAIVRALLEAGADLKQCQHPEMIAEQLISYYGDAAPEPELINLLRFLRDRGGALSPNAAATAEKKKLPATAAYLRDPDHAVAPAAAPKLALLGGTAKLERDDLKAVCRGEGIAALPAYQKQAGLVSPIIAFEDRQGDVFWPGWKLPRWWMGDDFSHTQLVVCVRLVEKKSVQECRYEGGAGGLTIYSAVYELAVRDAKTAAILGKKTLPLEPESTRCPMLKWGGHAEAQYPNYDDALVAFAKDYAGI